MPALFYKYFFYSLITLIWVVFKTSKVFNRKFKEAVGLYQAVYNFKYKDASVQLVFDRGNIELYYVEKFDPDFEINFLDLPGVLKSMKENPGDVMRLMLENKIAKKGNNYYLLKFGYLIGLCRVQFQAAL